MDKSGKCLVNLDKANGIYIDEVENERGEIYAAFGLSYPEDVTTLGYYDMNRAKEILKEIADRQGKSTYYMPEE